MSNNDAGNGRIQLSLNPSHNDESIPKFDSIPKRETVATQPEGKEYNAGTIDESMLSDEERETVARFVDEIDILNVDQMVQYGSAAQKNISDFSISVLKKVKTLELGEVGTALKELTVALDATIEPEKKGLAGLFQKAKRGVGSIMANYAKAESNVDRIEKDLVKHQSVLAADVSMYQQMYDLNTRYYKELTMYIIAGKKALDKARKGDLELLKDKAEQTQKQEDIQQFKDYMDQCNRFEKRLGDLEITRMIAIQVAPQVRMLQNNDRELLDKLQSSLSNTIPLWRNQLVLALGIDHTRRAIDAQEALSDKTNELLAKNSETLKMASIEAAKESERPIVDMATLRKCNKDLITSINEVVKIHEQGTIKRQQAQEELVRIETELKDALLEVGRK